MPHQNPSDAELAELLQSARTIAVVGASSKPEKPSYGVFRRLLAAGYQVIPVNPNERVVQGQKAYPSLRAIPQPIDIVDVFRRAEETPPLAREAAGIGAKVFWLQSGIVNEEAAAAAQAAGLRVVMDLCLGVEVAVLQVNKRPAP
jgi:predicted CoA-binding protein